MGCDGVTANEEGEGEREEMIVPTFTFDAEANGYISEEITICEEARVRIELSSRAPVVTLKKEADGGYGIYGQSPRNSDRYEIRMTSTHEVTIKLAVPVEVTKCWVMN